MNAIQGYLEKLGGNFMIAAFIPSFAFVTACMIAFSHLIPTELIKSVQFSLHPLDGNGVIVLLIAILMGFTLTSLNTYVYKLFEGYVLTDYLKPLKRIELTRARRIRNKRDLLNRKIGRIEKWQQDWPRAKLPEYQKMKLKRINQRVGRLINQRDALAADYDQKYPPTEALIMPTRLGNILRAAEAYPQDRYGADAVALWPRMVWAIDKEYMSHVDSANDQCSFLLNCSLLSGIFVALSFAASGYELFFQTNALASIAYFLTGVITLGIAWFFYSASLVNVTKYGNLIRSSYDLFRFNLIQLIHLKLPVDTHHEKELWERISEFITIGELYSVRNFDYPTHVHEEDKDEIELRSLLTKAGLSDADV